VQDAARENKEEKAKGMHRCAVVTTLLAYLQLKRVIWVSSHGKSHPMSKRANKAEVIELSGCGVTRFFFCYFPSCREEKKKEEEGSLLLQEKKKKQSQHRESTFD
jgi:hypothetical protein